MSTVTLKGNDGNEYPAIVNEEGRLLVDVSSLATNVTFGNQTKVKVIDEEGVALLTEILKQLKIMNLHLESVTGEGIDKQEVE